MASLLNIEPISAPHKTRRFWKLVALVSVSVLLGSLYQRALGLPLHTQITSGIETFAALVTAFWFGVRFGRIGWLILVLLVTVFIFWTAFHMWLHRMSGA